MILLIEFILGVFLYAKFKKGYRLMPVFHHWTIYLPLCFGLFYIFLECCMYVQWHYFLPYQQLIKTATLLSYIPLVITYKLYENDNIKYKNKEFLSILTSPMVKAGVFLWLGSALNKLAMYFNSGYMPTYPSVTYWTKYIKPDGFIDGLHVIGTPYSSAIPFCNIFDWGFTVVSIGDILIRFYVFIILYHSIKRADRLIK